MKPELRPAQKTLSPMKTRCSRSILLLEFVLSLLQVLAVYAAGASTFSDANWLSISTNLSAIPDTDRQVLAAAADTSGNLYFGGEFIVAGGVVANRIAKWNGTNWSTLGSGMNGTVVALAVSGGDLYAAGDFTTAGGVSANYIAKWNGTNWSMLGSGMNGTVVALAVSGTNLYAGGWFTTAGGNPANSIAKWDGNGWSALGSGMSGEYPDSTSVNALAVSGSDLYVGGGFTMAGGVSATNMAKWNGSSWSALGSGMGPDSSDFGNGVQALAVSGTNLYAGGRFTTAGGNPVNFIAKWDGNSWSPLGSGTSAANVYPPDVTALVVSGGDLYAGGYFEAAGGVKVNMVGKWDGSSWSALGSGLSEPDYACPCVTALAVSGSDLYAAGTAVLPNVVSDNNVAKWNGSSWSTLGSTTPAIVTVGALAASSSNLFVGGAFTTMGGVATTNIAKWDGNVWSALDLGINGAVNALAVSGGDLYVGGVFMTAGGVAATNIAKWDGRRWSALGSGIAGVDPLVCALAVSGNDLYAGGWFTTAGGVPANNIAKWDGSTWSALGSGMGSGMLDGMVTALAVSGSDLYAAGDFMTPDGVSANYISKWNGSSWSSLNSGLINVSVSALAVSGSGLYAGGYFRKAPGDYASIAKWDGSGWSWLGSGVGLGGYGPTVAALTVRGTDLYVGGSFTTAGGVVANYIAKWDGSSWSALGSGLAGGYDTSVFGLALMGGNLYAGGKFATAGGKISPNVAQAVLGDPPGFNQLVGSISSGGAMQLSYTGDPTVKYALDRTFNLEPPVGWVGQQTNTMSISGVLSFTSAPVPGTNNFWRIRSVP
jgi:hypothetical protein